MTLAPEDDGRLFRALAPYLETLEPGPIARLPEQASRLLWNEFILLGKNAPRERHGMLLGLDAWPSVKKSKPLPTPLPAELGAVRFWLVFWMRERAAVIAGPDFAGCMEDILRDDDEAVIAINTDTLDSLQSWGGHGEWVQMRRPR